MNSTNNIKSKLDSKMTILVIITILSSILGAWPYIALAAVFLYTQVFAKITVKSVLAIIGMIAFIPIVGTIINNSKQLLQKSSRIGYFALTILSTFTSSAGVFNVSHSITASIITAFAVLIVIIFVFSHDNDSHQSPWFLPKSWYGPEGYFKNEFSAILDKELTGIAIMAESGISVLIGITIVISASPENGTSPSQLPLLLSKIGHPLLIWLVTTIVVISITLGVSLLTSILKSKKARKMISQISNESAHLYILRLSQIINGGDISKLQSYIRTQDSQYMIRHYSTLGESGTLDYAKTENGITHNAQLTLQKFELADVISTLGYAYPNQIGDGSLTGIISKLKKYTQYQDDPELEKQLANGKFHLHTSI